MPIQVKKDGEGYLAEVIGHEETFYAYGFSKEEAIGELYQVLLMIRDHQLDQLTATQSILTQPSFSSYAV